MLSNEDRMIPHRGLFAVVGRFRVGQTALDELAGVLQDCLDAALAQVVGLFATQVKSAAKARPTERRKKIVDIAHILISFQQTFSGIDHAGTPTTDM